MNNCIVENCDKISVSKGYCDKHRKQIARHNTLRLDKEHRTTCTIDGCDIKHYSRGYCRNHYYKYVRKLKNKML